MVKTIIGMLVWLPILVTVALVTLSERKWLAYSQNRVGPTVVGTYGLLQPFADALKLLTKENILPSNSNKSLFLLAPGLSLIFSLLNYMTVPYSHTNESLLDINNNIILNLLLSTLGVYGILLSGWAANSSYSLLGSLRSSAQIISYELVFITLILIVIVLTNSFNYTEILELQLTIPLLITIFPIFVIYFITVLAETNRAPLDLPEAESELVAGFFTEHSSIPFVIFFLAEYNSMLFLSYFSCLLFWSNKNIFMLKVILIILLFIWIRSTLPRIRFDMLIKICWKWLLPISMSMFVLIYSLVQLI